MRIFKSNYDLLKRASPAKPGKRFVSFFIDLMVVFLLSTLLFLGGKAIVTSTNEFTTNETNVKEEVKYYNNFIEKAVSASFIYRHGIVWITAYAYVLLYILINNLAVKKK